jgi:cation:H+ antiporter
MLLSILILLLGFLVLIKGADWLVDGASVLAKKYNISDLAIGLTIVAFGTSAPELVVNLIASYNHHSEIVYGNVIGSNNFNLFAILGIAGLITPLIVSSSSVWKEIPISFFAIILMFILSNDFLSTDGQELSRIDGIILLLMFGLFLLYVYKQLKTDPTQQQVAYKPYSNLKIGFLILIGLTSLILGGRLVVSQAIEIAEAFGLSEKIIGLTIIAAGTSLPELATSVVAALKKNIDIAVGNIIGSNIFNIFLILGASAVIRPIPYNNLFNTDMYLLAFGTLLLFIAMFTGTKRKLDRWEAAILLLIFIGYTAYLVMAEL